MTKKRRNYKELGPIELPEEEDRRIAAMIEQAEKELEETRVSFRWGKEQIEVVKKAANLMGIPYQTFLKLAVYEHALAVLKSSEPIVKRTLEAA